MDIDIREDSEVDFSLLSAPVRSRLYHLEPFGVGTVWVESLTGYVARLAGAHSVLAKTLIAREILPVLKRSYLCNPSHHNLSSVSKRGSSLNGILVWAADWVDALEGLTMRNDLRFLTMLHWSNVLPTRGLLRRTRAWCPACYEDWRASGQLVYEPLIWALEPITLCPVHRIRLQSRCGHAGCGKILPTISQHSRVGYCSGCGRWLGASVEQGSDQILDPDELEWQRWVWQGLGELLAAAPRLSPPTRNDLARSVSVLLAEVAGNNASALARVLGSSGQTVRAWRAGTQLPRFDALLKMCHLIGAAPLRFLTGNISADGLGRIASSAVPVSSKLSDCSSSFDADSLRHKLETALESAGNPPPSMAAVARRVGHDHSHLIKLFPDLCRRISARYRDFCRAEAEWLRSRIRDEVRQMVLCLHEQGIYPSFDRVRGRLGNPNHMRAPEALATWRTMVLELGWERRKN